MLIRSQRPKTIGICNKDPKLRTTDQKFYLPGRLINSQGSLPIAIMAQIRQSGHLLMSKPDSCEIISKSDQRFFQNKLLRTIFEKSHQRNIPVKLFQNLTSDFGEKSFLRISSCPYSAKSPIHQSHIYRQIKILRTSFEKGHSRNIPAKLFQNLTSSFEEEDFLRISSCPNSARSPHSPEPCLWTDQNFANIF